MILFSLAFIDTLLILSLFGLTLVFYAFLRNVGKSRLSDRELPLLSVIVPARNEEAKIGRCLTSLLDQDYPNYEIVVIDDRSTDRTGDIIEEFSRKDARIKYVKGKDAPQGWIGKCNALAHAVGYASGDWFLFTDADTCHRKNSLKDSVSYALSEKVDLVSFVPVQELGSFWERLVMPTLLSSFLVGDPFHSVNDPNAKRAYAYGQYILCRRSSYLATGGHQSVRDEIVEDHAIARVFKEKGYKISVADGRTLYSVRMYTNLETLWQGWTKNLYSLIDSHIFNLSLILLLLNAVMLFPYYLLFSIGTKFISLDLAYLKELIALATIQFVVLLFWFARTTDHHAGVSLRHFFLLPLGSLAVTALYLHAAYLVLTGGQVNWKGRRYVVNASKTITPPAEVPPDTILDVALLPDGTE